MRQFLLSITLLVMGCIAVDPPTVVVADAYYYCDPPSIICEAGSECWWTPYWRGDWQFCSPECTVTEDCWYGFFCAAGYPNNHCMPE